MKPEKQFTIFVFVITICFMSLKLNLKSTQLGYYRGEGYNFFNPLEEQPIADRQLLIDNMPRPLMQAYQAQGVNLNTVHLDSADIKIWGPIIDADQAPADRIYNVVFHPDVQRWRASDADFNTNLLVGLFDPKGVTQAGVSEAIPFNTFGQINVNKHDHIYYSPNNARFAIEPGRQIVTFWTAALSEDKTKTVITFNIIVDDRPLSDLIGGIVTNEALSDEQAMIQIETLIVTRPTLSSLDVQAMYDAISMTNRLHQVDAEQERIQREQQEAADRELAQRLADQAARDAQDQERAQQELERIQREQQEAADRELAQRLADQAARDAQAAAQALQRQQEQERIQNQEAAQRAAHAGAQASGHTEPALNRPDLSQEQVEAVIRERAKLRAEFEALFGN